MRGRGVPPERLDAVEEHYRHFGGVEPAQRPQPRADRGHPRADGPAGVLRQPQLAPAGRGHRRRDGARRGAPGARVRHQRLRRLLGVPAVPRGHRAGPQGRRRPGAGAGEAAALLRSPGVRRGERRRRARRPRHPARRGPRPGPGWCSPRTRCRPPPTPPPAPRRRAGTATPGRSPRPPGWSPASWASPSTTSCGSPAPARRRCRGSSRTSSTTSTPARAGVPAVVVAPVGFVSDHVEVIWDLDTEARERAEELGMAFARAATAGPDPRFADMVVELVAEHTDAAAPRGLSATSPRPGAPSTGCRARSTAACRPGDRRVPSNPSVPGSPSVPPRPERKRRSRRLLRDHEHRARTPSRHRRASG